MKEMVKTGTKRATNLKVTVTLWLKERISKGKLLQIDSFENNICSFPLIGLCSEAEVFVQPTHERVLFGYHSIEWHGHIPHPILVTKHLLNWEPTTDRTN